MARDAARDRASPLPPPSPRGLRRWPGHVLLCFRAGPRAPRVPWALSARVLPAEEPCPRAQAVCCGPHPRVFALRRQSSARVLFQSWG